MVAQESPQTEFVIVTLSETAGSGVEGTALLRRNGEQTDIEITVTRTEFSPPFPYVAHLHEGEGCNQEVMDGTELLNPVEKLGRSETTVNHTLDELLEGGWLVNVHQDESTISSDLTCGFISPFESGVDAGLRAIKDQVRVFAPGDEEGEEVKPNTLRAVTTEDAIGIDGEGEAWLQFLDSLLVRIFKDSEAAYCPAGIEGERQEDLLLCPEVSEEASPEQAVVLTDGGVAIYTRERIAVYSGNAVIRSTGTQFLVTYDESRDLSWVLVKDGAVEVTAAGSTVTVNADEQTQVEGNDPPRDPQPATRVNVEGRYPGVFPALEAATLWAIRENDALDLAAPPASTTSVLPAPTGIFATLGEGGVDLSWEQVPNAEIRWYHVFRDGAYLDSVEGARSSFRDATVSPRTTYTYAVSAEDTSGRQSGLSSPVTITTAPVEKAVDTPPSPPTDLVATGPDTSAAFFVMAVDLVWTASGDDQGVIAYRIFRNDEYLDAVDGATTSYSDTAITWDQTYTYYVFAVDSLNQLSGASNPATVTIGPKPQTDEPPTAPSNLRVADRAGNAVYLAWDASFDDEGIAFYHLLRDGGFYDSVDGSTTNYTDGALGCGPDTTYQVYAEDTSAQTSFLSNAVTVDRPSCNVVQ